MSLKDPQARKEYNRKYQQVNKERIAEKRKKWVIENREKFLEYHREYNRKDYILNKERLDIRHREYAKAHPEDSVRRTQKYVAKNRVKVATYNQGFNQTVEGKYRMLVYRAKHYLGTPVTIEEFTVLNSSPCVYCGHTGKVGIDRIDNSGGYTKDNTAPACTLCNFMKKAMTVNGFLEHITKIYKHNATTQP